MVDVISGGPSGEPWRPRVWLVVLVVIGLGVAAAGYIASRPRPPNPGAEPSATATTSQPATVAQGFTGPRLHTRTGLRLLVDGDGLRIVDVDRDTITPVPPLAHMQAKLLFVPVQGGDAFTVSTCETASCSQVYFVPAGGNRAVPLTKGIGVAAAADGRDLWVTTADAAGRSLVREMSVDGRPRSAAYPLPADRYVLRGTDAGLMTLVADPAGESAGQLWNPVTGHTGTTFAHPVAVASNMVAWLGPDCVQVSCPLRLTDLSGGHTRTVPVPAGAVIDGATFSPDAAQLAVAMEIGGGGIGPVTAGVVDVATGQVVGLPGTTISGGGPIFAWSRDGAWLALLSPGQSMATSMAIWHTGEKIVYPIPGPDNAFLAAPASADVWCTEPDRRASPRPTGQ